MVFSSIPFIFFFFPIFLIVYYFAPNKYKNLILLIFSLIFYAWGEPVYILLMIFSSVFNYIIGRKIEKYSNRKKQKQFLIISVIVNLILLGFFKYADFLIEIINGILRVNIPLLKLGLPIGISFYTFQIMSYIIDVYNKKVKVSHNIINFMSYVTMFPQLIAGPIVRYETIDEELNNRKHSFTKTCEGLLRFMRGLFKKVLIANNIGYLFTIISSMTNSELSILTAWLGILAFTFQIYFDFSGYSDMAIGMGKMLGFNYLENFDHPYIAKSITDFWRRWHISLSSWFRDYVYIPLKGSKCSTIINIRNILIVWLLTGLWHGASLNFLIWGLYYGLLLILEKFVLKDILNKMPNTLKHIYTLFFVILGWAIFAFDDMGKLSSYLKIMFGFGNVSFINGAFIYYLKNYFMIIIISIVFSCPIYKNLKEIIKKQHRQKLLFAITLIIYIVLFIITVSYLVGDTYNPFLYFRF